MSTDIHPPPVSSFPVPPVRLTLNTPTPLGFPAPALSPEIATHIIVHLDDEAHLYASVRERMMSCDVMSVPAAPCSIQLHLNLS